MRLKGKVALITGSANGGEGRMMGIGGAAAGMFAREGAAVVVADIDDAAGEQTASGIRAGGGRALFVHLDVTEEDQWAAAIEAVTGEFGPVDVLVNNAGIGVLADIEETTVELWDAHQKVHGRGTWLGTKSVAPSMRERGGGSIINVSSVHAMTGSPTLAAYHAAKGAVRSFTKMAAIQYAPVGIRVNSVHPGYAMTPMTQRGFEDEVIGPLVISRIPIGRFASPEEIAAGILFLASDESSYITGAELVIDGGVTAQ
jgi:NAD(P)-dependent dehydrogenase (short-subunit alcohol dehydrogenase family)